MAKRKHWSAILTFWGACDPAVRWARRWKTPQDAWDNCRRNEWMHWFCIMIARASQVGVCMYKGRDQIRPTQKAARYWSARWPQGAGACADLVRKYWPNAPRVPRSELKRAGLV